MKYKTLDELAMLDPADLAKECNKASLFLLELRMKKAGNELKQTHSIRECRRYIAQIRTIESSRVTPELA
ncbi:MAG TPA: 50S ribosomal protein L29 [bacterium]|nr:50S ribosomal protein L29 [bacterium]